MGGRPMLLHHFPHTLKLGRRALTRILLFQEERRLVRKRRTVFPDIPYQVDGIVDPDLSRRQRFLKLPALSHGKYPSVKRNRSASWNTISQILRD